MTEYMVRQFYLMMKDITKSIKKIEQYLILKDVANEEKTEMIGAFNLPNLYGTKEEVEIASKIREKMIEYYPERYKQIVYTLRNRHKLKYGNNTIIPKALKDFGFESFHPVDTLFLEGNAKVIIYFFNNSKAFKDFRGDK